MDKKKIPQEVRTSRRDLSEWLWHLVRRDEDSQQILRNIIEDGAIRGSCDISTKETVICFSEAPLRELINQDPVLSQNGYTRLALYGIGIKKDWVYNNGGLPVIYQPNSKLDELPEHMRWRHVEFDLSKPVDFTWQREWRILSDKLILDFSNAIVLVEDTYGLEDLLWEIWIDVDVNPGEGTFWSSTIGNRVDFIPLEYAKIDDDKSIEVCVLGDYSDAVPDNADDLLDSIGPDGKRVKPFGKQ